MGAVFLLSLTAALNPTLLAATTVMLLLPNPKRVMLGYLAGAMCTSITLGLVIVFSFKGSAEVKFTRETLSPAVDLALGGIALLAARALASDRFDVRRSARREGKRGDPPRWQRAMSKGTARTAFVIGAMLTLPGASYLAGLHRLAALDYSDALTVLSVIVFNVVMLMLLEVPLLCFAVAPEWTPTAIARAKAWIRLRVRHFAIRGLTFVGLALVAKGAIGLIV